MQLIRIFLIGLALTATINISAQVNTDQSIIPPSPNAEMIQKFIDVPVNYHTGVPDISIPIYTIKTRSQTLPIVLRYHADGFKPSSTSGFVGLGWEIDCGGMISRSIRGLPDEGNVIDTFKTRWLYEISNPDNRRAPKPFETSAPAGWSFNLPTADPFSLWRQSSTINGGYYADQRAFSTSNINQLVSDINSNNSTPVSNFTNPTGYTVLDGIKLGYVDLEPDLFYFSSPSFQGKFRFASDGSIFLHDQSQDLKIETDYRFQQPYPNPHFGRSADGTKYVRYLSTSKFVNYFNYWKITTPDAKTYFFGGYKGGDSTHLESEYKASDGAYHTREVDKKIQDWYLSKIVDDNYKDTITFNYNSSLYRSLGALASAMFISYDVSVSSTCTPGNLNLYSKARTEPRSHRDISKITTESEIITFYSSYLTESIELVSGIKKYATQPKLDSIRIVSRLTDKLISQINFRYSFFKTGDYLKLNEVVFKSPDTQVRDKKYSLTYFDTTLNNYTYVYDSINNLSKTINYSRTAVDYWGYYNGRLGNESVSRANFGVPNTNSCTSYANRKPQWPYIMVNALTGIQYPTGGNTKFDYEPNTTVDVERTGMDIFPLSNDTVAGLRIKRVSFFDKIKDTSHIVEYEYKEPLSGQSSGVLNLAPRFYEDVYYQCPSTAPGYNKILVSNTIFGSDRLEKPLVEYSYVRAKQVKNGVNNGYTDYQFFTDLNTENKFFTNSTTRPGYETIGQDMDKTATPLSSYYAQSRNLLSGKPKEVAIYNSAGKLLSREKYNYELVDYTGERPYINGVIYGSFSQSSFCNFYANPAPPRYNVANNDFSQYVVRKERMEIEVPLMTSDGTLLGYTKSYISLVNEDMNDGSYENQLVMSNNANLNNTMRVPPGYRYYYTTNYFEWPKKARLSRKEETGFFSNNDSLKSISNYYFESPYHNQVTKSVAFNSTGDTTVAQNFYAFDFADSIKYVLSNDTVIGKMRKQYNNAVIASHVWKNSKLLSSSVTLFKDFYSTGQSIYPLSSYSSTIGSPVSYVSGSPLNTTYPVRKIFPDNVSFSLAKTYNYDASGKLIDVTDKNAGKASYIWDYKQQYPVASIINAVQSDVSYTSFESDGKGNWVFSGTASSDNTSPTGGKCYNLSGGAITRSGLSAGNIYQVSYWTKNGSAYSITGTVTAQGYPKQGRSINGWTFFEHRITGQTSVSVSGSGYIDELRFYPAAAQLVTYSYDPSIGMTSQSDPVNNIIYYEYDAFGRMKSVRDADRNIVKMVNYEYDKPANGQLYYSVVKSATVYKNDCGFGISGASYIYTVPAGKYISAISQADADWQAQKDVDTYSQVQANLKGDCVYYYNIVKTGTFTRNNCGTCYTGSSVTYTVVAGKYGSSVSQAAANQLAQDEVNANGQAYANANGTCTPSTTCVCTCSGVDKKCISGVCQTGVKVYTDTYSINPNTWVCVYHYEWSDGSWSSNYTHNSPTPCDIDVP